MTHFIELVKALAWPFVVLIIAFSFRAQLKELFERSSGLTFKVLGFKVALTVRQVQDAAEELFKEVSTGLSGLTQKQRELFQAARTSNGIKTVDQLTEEIFGKAFDRLGDELEEFRALRDSQLVRPREGGKWKSDKHPVLTPYAQIILKSSPAILAPAKPSK
jgi:hypothetical protein